jgi:modulator of FtsH protease HflK
MRADYLSYRRSTGTSVLGLVVQVAFATIVLVYGLMASDHAAVSASIFMWVGVFAWLTLVIVFDQHRRERLEAMESESLSRDAGASVFEKQGDEFRVAARRVDTMYRYVVPIISLLFAGALIGMGIWRFQSGLELVEPGKLAELTKYTGWQLGLGIGIGVIGFLFARYASTMAKQKVWQNLRAGASFAVGSALLALSLAIGQLVDIAGPDSVLRYLMVVVPGFLVVMGVEIVLNLVLDVYRPRKAGETPRPAFESRLLGFVAAPDRIAQSIGEAINYQLGFDVSSGWFYQLLRRSLAPLIIVGLVVMWGFSTITVLQPHQRGTILRFGKPVRENIGPGWHWKMPWPIDSVYIPEYVKTDDKGRRAVGDLTATGIRTVQLGTSPPGTAEPLLWTNDHLGEEIFQLVSSGVSVPVGGNGDTESLMDFGVVSMEIPLNYAVKDVALYDQLAPPMMRNDLLKAVAQRELTQFLQTVRLDEVLGPRRVDLTNEIRQRIEAAFAKLNPDPATGKPRGAGVEIVYVGIVGAHPPKDKDVAASFEKVVDADQKYLGRMEAARAEELKVLTRAAGSVDGARALVAAIDAYEKAEQQKAPPEKLAELDAKWRSLLDAAGGRTATLISEARAERWTRHMKARGLAEEYKGRLVAYEAAPQLYRANTYFEAMMGAMRDARVYITDDNAQARVDLAEKDTGLTTFTPKEAENP